MKNLPKKHKGFKNNVLSLLFFKKNTLIYSTLRALLYVLLLTNPIFAQNVQTISGTVSEKNETQNPQLLPIIGANIYFINTPQTATNTDINGKFIIKKQYPADSILIVSFVGFKTDTLHLNQPQNQAQNNFELILTPLNSTLNAVTITDTRSASFISDLQTIKIETITQKELSRAACCNLSESFETSPTIDVKYSDAVSGAKEIKMLGLDGKYAQILTENTPMLRGLATTYGLSYIPGIWMDAIQLNKGSGSVTNGYESITGQINVELQKPDKAEKVYLNLFASTDSRLEANLNLAHKFNPKWSTALLLSTNATHTNSDHNHDNFKDLANLNTYTAFNRWHYNTNKIKIILTAKALKENRLGGELGFNPAQTTNLYGINISTQRAEFFAKTAYIFDEKNNKSLGIIWSAINHQQQSQWGLKKYEGLQNQGYINAIYQTPIALNQNHTLKLGASYLYDYYNENIEGGSFQTQNFKANEHIKGFFSEYTFKQKEFLAIVAGARIDFHNLYGTIFTPRIHLKINPLEKTSIRIAAGKGTHIARIFAENVGIFATGRNLVIKEKLQPEHAWNAGISLTQKFKNANNYLSADAYYTYFINQVIADAYTNSQTIAFYNLNGKSFAQSLQIEAGFEILKNWTAKIGYRLDNTKTTYNNKLLYVPLQARQKLLATTSYSTPQKKWQFDATLQYFGKKYLTLPTTTDATPLQSSPYIQALAQITYNHKKWSIYTGSENIGNYFQHNPILNAQNPFSVGFDAANVWGPIMGRTFYVGMRHKIK